MEGSETRILLEKWYEGDREALNSLLDRDLPWVRARVRQRLGALLRRKGETEDYVQEAMVEVLRYGPRFLLSDRGHFRALLSRIVENVLRDQSDHWNARRRAAEKERALPRDSILDLDSPRASVPRPSQIAQELEREAWVGLALELLAAEDREVIVLREFDGLAFGAIGTKLGISEDAARMRFQRALPRLADKVKGLRRGGLPEML